MRSGFRLGKIFGIQLHIDWSWLLIFFLTTWNLAVGLASLHPTWGSGLRWSLAVIGSLLFFASVLAHEIAHSLVAQARGTEVHSIRLHLFGGVSNIQQEPDSPGAEFTMAILGPVTSFVIGIVLLLIVGAATRGITAPLNRPLQVLSQLNPVFTILMWLGSVNIILAIFNMIPGFPLDGGRVLRSILWAVTDNLVLATRWASWIGRGIAWLLIVGGIAMAFGFRIPIFGEGFTGGLWLAFIGWFLHNAAVQSYQQLLIREALEDVPIADIMRRNPPTVHPDQTVGSLVHENIMQSDDHGFPVIAQDQLVGLVTLEDVRSVRREDWDRTLVREIMTPRADLATLTLADDASKALDQLAGRDVRQLPVITEGRLEGLVRRRDLVRWLQMQSRYEGSRAQPRV